LHIQSLSLKTPVEKLKAFLVMLCCRWQNNEQRGKNLELPLSRADIASYLNLTPESVSRAFSKLKEDGVLEMPTFKHISVRDFKVLFDEVLEGQASDFIK
ncbi:MAG: helix-turn-helix domain-containing protein, partial [Sphingomonadales bacterium]